jgi:hypothetical protein
MADKPAQDLTTLATLEAIAEVSDETTKEATAKVSDIAANPELREVMKLLGTPGLW